MPYSCNYPGCKRVFKEIKYLTRHEKTHSKEFKCTLCTKTFARADHLKKHEKTHEKTFNCTICSKTFVSDANRKTHEETHQSRKCKYCSKVFSRGNNCLAHERICGGHGSGVKLRERVLAPTNDMSFRIDKHIAQHVEMLIANLNYATVPTMEITLLNSCTILRLQCRKN